MIACTAAYTRHSSGNGSRASKIIRAPSLSLTTLTLLLTAGLLLTNTFPSTGPALVLAGPLDNQLPDTTGLFFGKRHPNMNNLLFGRRSLGSGLEEEQESEQQRLETRYLCRAVRQQCDRLRLWEE